jgi:hypothetical protein
VTVPIPSPDPDLEYLCKGYFNQDWDLEGETAEAVLDGFSKDSMDAVVGARDAAARLLAEGLSDEDLAALLDRTGLEYAPDVEGMDHRQWLELVVDRLTARLEERRRG